MNFHRFSIRSALLLLTIFGALLAWYASNRHAWAHEQQVLSELNSSYTNGWGNLDVLHTGDSFSGCIPTNCAHKEPTWFGNRVGAYFNPDLFERIRGISFNLENKSDDALSLIAEIPSLQTIAFFEGTFSNKSLAEFARLRPDVEINSIDRAKLH